MLRRFGIGVVSFDTKLLKQLRINDSLLTLLFGFRREHGAMQRAGFLRLRAVSKIFQIRIGDSRFRLREGGCLCIWRQRRRSPAAETRQLKDQCGCGS